MSIFSKIPHANPLFPLNNNSGLTSQCLILSTSAMFPFNSAPSTTPCFEINLPHMSHNLKQREIYKRFWLTTMQQHTGISHTVKKTAENDD